MENNHELALSEIKQLLQSNNQIETIKAMKAIGSKGEQAIPILRETIRSNDDLSLRTIAIVVVGEIGKDAISAVPDLIIQLKGTDEQLRMAASLSLVRIGKGSISLLKDALLQTEDENTLFWCSWALAMIDASELPKEAISILMHKEKHTDNIIEKTASQEALAKVIGNTLN